MNDLEKLCDKIEQSAREAAIFYNQGKFQRALIELDAARSLAKDASKIVMAAKKTALL